MSNRAYIERCEFVAYTDREISYGFRGHDSYEQMFCDTATADTLKMEPLQFLTWVVENVNDEKLDEILDFVRENKSGIYIDGSWFDWDEIESVLTMSAGDPNPSTRDDSVI